MLLSWKLSKTKCPHFEPFKVGRRLLFVTDMVTILPLNSHHYIDWSRWSLVKTKTGNCCFNKTGPAAELLSWQQHNRCRFVSFVINIFGAKFEKQCFNISRDIVHSVFCKFSCTPYDVITFLICIIGKRQYL